MHRTLRRTRPLRLAPAIMAALAAGVPAAATAQGVVPATAGAVAGTGVGVAAAVGAVVARARLADAYLWSRRDVLGWPAVVVASGALSGIVLGATDRRGLARGAVGATALGALGAGVGALLGEAAFDDEGGGWAGAFMGAGIGAVAGWVLGASIDGAQDAPRGGDAPLEFRMAIPVGGR